MAHGVVTSGTIEARAWSDVPIISFTETELLSSRYERAGSHIAVIRCSVFVRHQNSAQEWLLCVLHIASVPLNFIDVVVGLLTCMTPGQKNLDNIAYILETLGPDINASEHAGSSASIRSIEIDVTPPPSEHAHDQTTIDGFLAYDWKALDVEVSRLTHLAAP